ncbi:MAG: class SAM-dependent methyltransferase [Bacteroidetes bacterium]|nr:class SAM-dependent methyltransferase [Bacteroidota bacterium]
MIFKHRIKTLQTSTSAWNRFIYISAKQLWSCFCIIINAELRNCFLTKVRFGQAYYQRAIFTAFNRYPSLFRACADYLNSIEHPKILSFGCSTGEEVFSIGQYLPHATIMGIDINLWCLKQCWKRNHNSNYTFAHRFSKEFEWASNFDAIFCLAVFQRTENRTNKNENRSVFLFEKFESDITLLDKKIKPNGLLIIDHSDFNFEETCVASAYKPLKSFEQNKCHRNRPVFDRHNLKIANEHENYRVFVKMRTS